MSFLKKIVPPNAELGIKIEGINYPGGAPIKGSVILYTREAFTVDQVRIEAREHEHYSTRGKESTNYHVATLYAKDVVLATSFVTSIGFKSEYPFTVEIPKVVATRGGHVVYLLKAVVVVKDRPDLTYETNPFSHDLFSNDAIVLDTGKKYRRCLECKSTYEGVMGNRCPQCGSYRSSPTR